MSNEDTGRVATQDEKDVFRNWFIGRDDLTWTRLQKPFRLHIQQEPINCTVLHPEEDLFILDAAALKRMRLRGEV